MYLKLSVLLKFFFILTFEFFVECKNFKIVGGNAITILQVPFQIVYYSDGDFVCSGSLISPLFVLTAAHCTYFFPSRITIRLGSSFRDDRGGIERKVRKYYTHPNYNSRNYDYDFALLRLAIPVMYSNYTQPVRLPEPGAVLPVGFSCTASGWGLTNFNDLEEPPLQLLAADLQISNFTQCRSQYQRVSQDITDRMFCASVPDASKDACLGDSGGPLVCNNTLYGIISFGYGCAMKDFPGIYSNVSYVLPWIKKVALLP